METLVASPKKVKIALPLGNPKKNKNPTRIITISAHTWEDTPGLAVHPLRFASKEGERIRIKLSEFRVTHIASGLGFGGVFYRMDDAHGAMRDLAELMDWTQAKPWEDLMRWEVMGKMWPRIREARNGSQF